MNLNRLALLQVRKAFKLTKSLQTAVTFTKAEPATFDYSKQAVAKIDKGSSVIYGMVTTTNRKQRLRDGVMESQDIITKTILFKSEDLEDFNLYTSALIDGIKWKPVSPVDDDGYTTTMTFIKER
jgi:hypothetical protein